MEVLIRLNIWNPINWFLASVVSSIVLNSLVTKMLQYTIVL